MLGTLVIILGTLIILALYWQRKVKMQAELLAEELIANATIKAKKILESANIELQERKAQAELAAKEELALRDKVREQTVQQKKLREQELLLEKQEAELAKRRRAIEEREATTQEMVVKEATREIEERMQRLYIEKRADVEERIEHDSHALIIQCLARLPHKPLTDATITEITLPNDEIKSKIIGREGKNIKAFQQLTGVTVIVDDRPSIIELSCYDPTRRLLAKIALTNLIETGKITVQSIEEEILAAQKALPALLTGYGQKAAESVEVYNLHPSICLHLGKLSLQSSYGQNLLDHSIEVANIIGQIATELTLDSALARRMGLLHDIGKAIQTANSHAIAGYNLLRECGESEAVANGVGCHHNEMAPATLEAQLVKPADFLSGARKTARMQTQELFHDRLREFEAKALTMPGVVSAYAVSGGRELHLFVRPDQVSDTGAQAMAKELAQELQPLAHNMRIQVSVFRETKVIEYSQ